MCLFGGGGLQGCGRAFVPRVLRPRNLESQLRREAISQVGKTFDLPPDTCYARFSDKLHPGSRNIGIDDVGSTQVEASRAAGVVQVKWIERERVNAPKPARNGRMQCFQYGRLDIEEGDTGCSKQVFERACREEIDVTGFDIDRDCPD